MIKELKNARVKYDKTSCSLTVSRQIKDYGPIRVINIKLDAQCASLVNRAIDAANADCEPDCFLLAFGMADSSAFDGSTWTSKPHSRELKP